MYSALQRAFDHFNERLFEGVLPPCLITLRSSRRQRGYHHAERFISADGIIIHELGLHPDHFTLHPLEVSLSTLVHEMVHHWQECFGKPTRSNHHNREWVAKMETIGLIPSDSGLPEGKQTGRRVGHYIEPNGSYVKACTELLAQGFALPWFDRYAPVEPKKVKQVQEQLAEQGFEVATSEAPVESIAPQANVDTDTDAHTDTPPTIFSPPQPRRDPKVRLVYPQCQVPAWTRPETPLMCGSCLEPMQTPA